MPKRPLPRNPLIRRKKPIKAEPSPEKPRDPREATRPAGRNDLSPELGLETRPLDELKVAPAQIRRLKPAHIDEIARGIRAHGFCVPLLVTRTGEVIDGHARLAAARALDLERVPCIRIDHLSDTEVRTLRLALNRLQERGEWDLDVLKQEFEALIDLEVDLSVSGFEVPEIDIVLYGDSTDGRNTLDAEANALPSMDPDQPTITRLGDLWHLGPHSLLCGDAQRGDTYERLLGDQKAGLLFTDPPYNVPIEGHVCGRGRIKHREFAMASGELSPAEFTKFLTNFLGAADNVLAEGTLAYVFMDWRHIDAVQTAAWNAKLASINLCVWVKPNGGMGSLYRSRHELVFVYKKAGRHQNNVQLGRHGRNRTNIWEYAGVNSLDPERRAEQEFHPTVKPVELVADAILDASSPGDIVLDPFIGSGTTLIAAEKTRRVCAGIEIDPFYIDTAIRRWQAITDQPAVHAETGRDFATLAEERANAPDEGDTTIESIESRMARVFGQTDDQD